MDNARLPPRLAPAAFIYAGASILALMVLPHLGAPLSAYHVPHAGALLLGKDPLQGLLWGLAIGGALAAAGQAMGRWTPWGRRLTRLLAKVVTPLHPIDALLLAALSSLAEELAFRGVALPYLGLAASSFLFGLAHIVPRRGLWPWSLWAMGAGVLLGWAALRTGGLLAPLTAHFVINAVGLVFLGSDGGGASIEDAA